MNFSTDTDLLHFEPELFKDAAWASQTLLAGTGNLAGTDFSISRGSFIDAKIASRHVIVLSNTVAGSFPIVAVVDATHLTISALHDQLFPEDLPPQPLPIATGNSISFFIRTFSPQAKVVSDLIRQAIGIVPGSAESESIEILNPQSLRRACALGTLQMIYSALAAAVEKPADLLARADVYERMYRRSLRSVRVLLDLNGDGVADEERALNVVEMLRA